MAERVLLTGISGYIGQHCGAELLNQGFEVVGTVRSLSKADATRSAIAAVAPVENLTFAEADLLSDKGWDEAMTGCTYVMHVASPFVLAEPKDENELIAPAVEGTRRVIGAAKRAGVRRLVLTSSTVAMISGKPSGRYGPDAWSDTSAKIGAYAKSKTLAERAAWDAVAGSEMELTVVNPGAVFGPSLGAQVDGQSVALMTDMIGGDTGLIASQWINPNGNGVADIFQILPQHTGTQHLTSFEDGLDRIDLTFLQQPGWHASQGAAADGSVLFNFWNTTTTDHFYLNVDGVGFGLINQPDLIL
jgi:nucleoside-diphosphate-sugar epimerase